MKNKALLGIMLGICILLTSCTLNTNEDDNSNLINAINQIEVYDYELNTFKTTYDDYKKNTKGFISSYFNKDNEVLLVYDGKQYKGKDLVGMSLNEYKELGNKLLLESHGKTEIKSALVDISDVYYNKDDSIKYRYVFTKQVRKVENEEVTIYKKYSFLKENTTWKISSANQFSATKDYKVDERTLSGYTTYDNKPIKYIQTIDLLKIQ